MDSGVLYRPQTIESVIFHRSQAMENIMFHRPRALESVVFKTASFGKCDVTDGKTWRDCFRP